MVRLALRNLFQSRVRLVVATGGVALALTLILVLDAVFTGVEGQMSAYIDHAGADVFVGQSGVRNLHMVASWLPASTVDQVRAVPGVADTTPILYLTDAVIARGDPYIAYVIGVPPDARMGTAWRVATGVAIPAAGEVVIDRRVAAQAGVRLGDQVTVLGQSLRVVGLSEGTASLVNSVAFIALEDFARTRPESGVVSFVLVKTASGRSADSVAVRIEAAVPGVTALSRPAFAAQERQLVRDMSTDVVTIMNVAGFLVGLAVLSLTVYTATLARRREYGVLRALGARNRQLYEVVAAQALISVALGFGVGLVLTLALATVVPRTGSNLALVVSAASLLKVGGVAAVIAGLAALLPVRQIAGLDPAMVYRGR
jgi:putative ABC transport system permease protein